MPAAPVTKSIIRKHCIAMLEDKSLPANQRLEAIGYLMQLLGYGWTRVSARGANAINRKAKRIQNTVDKLPTERLSELTSSVAA